VSDDLGLRPAGTRSVRLAESIAAQLRERILSGSLPNGTLPKQEELMQMFRVSGPSLREALRILEVEGLITVRRGKIGGAQIHRPDGASAAHAIGLTLQGEGTRLHELAETLLAFEPMCASACALRADRVEIMSVALEANLDLTAGAVGDGPEFTRLARTFHDLVVERTPNSALRLIVRSLVAIWSAQEESWAALANEAGQYPDVAAQEEVLDTHRKIASKIYRGNVTAAERIARIHLSASQEMIIAQYGDRVIDATSPLAIEGFQKLSQTGETKPSPLSVT
jgi:GntR family transcriptional regulator, transcriptional repressor for pyruvate dehydrogenase complex